MAGRDVEAASSQLVVQLCGNQVHLAEVGLGGVGGHPGAVLHSHPGVSVALDAKTGNQGDFVDPRLAESVLVVPAHRYHARKSSHATDLDDRRRPGLVREIYESNAIEFAGLPLSQTAEALASPQARQVEQAMTRYALMRALTAEKKLQEVLGLYGAKILANQMLASSDRALTETDLRSLHELILPGRDGGLYRQRDVGIQGSSHRPSETFDIARQMKELIDWLAAPPSEEGGPSVVRAAIAHAWLAHLHPFADGNGRLARLLANMALSTKALPPLIVQHAGDRGRYLDALEHSDEAGDVVLLLSLFVRCLNRELAELEQPDAALKLFQLDLASRGSSTYEWWSREFSEWLAELGAQLLLRGIAMEQVGWLAPSDFHTATTRLRRSAVMVARVREPSRNFWGMQIWLHMATGPLRRLEQPGQTFPALVFSIRVGHAGWSYLKVGDELGFREVTVMPGADRTTYVELAGGRVLQSSSAAEGPEFVARAVATALRLDDEPGALSPDLQL